MALLISVANLLFHPKLANGKLALFSLVRPYKHCQTICPSAREVWTSRNMLMMSTRTITLEAKPLFKLQDYANGVNKNNDIRS